VWPWDSTIHYEQPKQNQCFSKKHPKQTTICDAIALAWSKYETGNYHSLHHQADRHVHHALFFTITLRINPGVFEKAHADLPDDANYDSVNNEIWHQWNGKTKRSNRTQRVSKSDRLSRAMQEYTKAIMVGVDNKKEELVVQQQQLVATKKVNESTQ
jgi:hypothetical protein